MQPVRLLVPGGVNEPSQPYWAVKLLKAAHYVLLQVGPLNDVMDVVMRFLVARRLQRQEKFVAGR